MIFSAIFAMNKKNDLLIKFIVDLSIPGLANQFAFKNQFECNDNTSFFISRSAFCFFKSCLSSRRTLFVLVSCFSSAFRICFSFPPQLLMFDRRSASLEESSSISRSRFWHAVVRHPIWTWLSFFRVYKFHINTAISQYFVLFAPNETPAKLNNHIS